MKWILSLYHQYQAVILYLFFGGCTTLMNIVCYYVLYQHAGVSNLYSTILAWLVSVLFAYVTNRTFVFDSKASGWHALLAELAAFFGCRLATGVLDTVIMVVAVDLMHWNSLLWKVLSNILVIILNYVASKWLILQPKK